MDTDTTETFSAKASASISPVIEIEQLKKSFEDNEVLKGINLILNKGENLVVLGKSGTGKSVLIKSIVRLIWPEAEKLNVLGQDVLSLSKEEMNKLRVKMGFLFQGGALYDSMTVKENLEFPLRRSLSSKGDVTTLIEEALENVGLLEAINKMPSELSGGMRKRISLARTLILKPEIMLYDEPTTGLDTITSGEISELILEMQKKYKISSIIITHDMPCAKITSNRIMVLMDGINIAEGTYKELENSTEKNIRDFFKQ